MNIPDRFNDLFAEQGWIIYERMDMNVVNEAIQFADSGNIENAEKLLVDYYSPELVERELKTINAISSFRSRMTLAEKALTDYK